MPAEAEAAARSRRDWLSALAIYRNPRVVGMLFLGFSAGLPFLLVFSTLSLWLRDAEVTRSTVGFFSWVGITFSIKVLWAPVVDRVALPGLTAVLGKRRSWILLGQMGIVLGLLLIAMIDIHAVGGVPAVSAHAAGVFAVEGGLMNIGLVAPERGIIVAVALSALLIAFASATQDVAIDAYRIEAVPQELQGAMAAAYQLGYRLALLVAGAGALYLADFQSWQTAYLVMAGLMGIGIATVLVIREPDHTRDAASYQREAKVVAYMEARAHLSPRAREIAGWFYGAVVCPFLDFFQRNGRMALVILLFITVYRLSDITMGVMANVFYDDLGFTKTDIANISKLYGFFMSVGGAFLGGLLVLRFGLMRPLLLGAVLVATTNLLFAYMATQGPDLALLTLTISADNLSAGIAGSVFIAYLSSLTNTAYTATQYALFSSLFTLGGKFVAGYSGIVVDSFGYVFFFVYASALGLPAILLVLYLMHRERPALPAAAQSESG